MVHCFKFSYEGNTRYFIWDIESGSLHSVDCFAYLCALNRYGNISDKEKAEFDKIPVSEKKEIEEEFEILESQGVLNCPVSENILPTKSGGEIKALCLHICHDCNMRCAYCFAKDGTYNTPKDYMTFEVGKAAIDFLIEKSGKRKHLEADYFGGEPLLNFDTVKKITEYAKEKCKNAGKEINFTLTTNCLNLNEENARYLNNEMENVILSIDGRKEVHNRVRKTANGKDAFDLILNNAINFRKIRGNKKYYVRGTFTALNTDFTEDVKFLSDVGFDQISMEPVVLDESSPFAIKKCDLPEILKEYENLAQEYIERRKGEKWFNFFHFMIDLKGGPCLKKRLTGCGAGSEYIAVTPTGEIYPCHQFAGDKDFYMGNVLTKQFNTDIQKKFANITVLCKDACKNCFAKYYCSGGCSANAYHFNKDLYKPYETACEMMKKRLELSLAIYAIENNL